MDLVLGWIDQEVQSKRNVLSHIRINSVLRCRLLKTPRLIVTTFEIREPQSSDGGQNRRSEENSATATAPLKVADVRGGEFLKSSP